MIGGNQLRERRRPGGKEGFEHRIGILCPGQQGIAIELFLAEIVAVAVIGHFQPGQQLVLPHLLHLQLSRICRLRRFHLSCIGPPPERQVNREPRDQRILAIVRGAGHQGIAGVDVIHSQCNVGIIGFPGQPDLQALPLTFRPHFRQFRMRLFQMGGKCIQIDLQRILRQHFQQRQFSSRRAIEQAVQAGAHMALLHLQTAQAVLKPRHFDLHVHQIRVAGFAGAVFNQRYRFQGICQFQIFPKHGSCLLKVPVFRISTVDIIKQLSPLVFETRPGSHCHLCCNAFLQPQFAEPGERLSDAGHLFLRPYPGFHRPDIITEIEARIRERAGRG